MKSYKASTDIKGLPESEIVIAFVGALGTDIPLVEGYLETQLQIAGYSVERVRISTEVIPQLTGDKTPTWAGEAERVDKFMKAGNRARQCSKDDSILAKGAAALIGSKRGQLQGTNPKRAYLISSVKHPDEVRLLRRIYSQGFYLCGVYADEARRLRFLTDKRRMDPEQVADLMERDAGEKPGYGQHVTDTFHMSDFFLRIDANCDRIEAAVTRLVGLLFGNPYETPTFDEYAMFLAFAASLRSADLSRQVGAVLTRDKEILATGANDCPKYAGGLYWREFDEENACFVDETRGRDYMREIDSNQEQKRQIVEEVVSGCTGEIDADFLRKRLNESRIGDLIEFGRSVHAEMEALASCARRGVSTKGTTLYSTTFPCHNCTKHLVACGVSRVVYVEPYPKSLAVPLHDDAVTTQDDEGSAEDQGKRVVFAPFFGVGARRFFDLFSMKLGLGYEVIRKDRDTGHTVDWHLGNAELRVQLSQERYYNLENYAAFQFDSVKSAGIEGADA